MARYLNYSAKPAESRSKPAPKPERRPSSANSAKFCNQLSFLAKIASVCLFGAERRNPPPSSRHRRHCPPSTAARWTTDSVRIIRRRSAPVDWRSARRRWLRHNAVARCRGAGTHSSSPPGWSRLRRRSRFVAAQVRPSTSWLLRLAGRECPALGRAERVDSSMTRTAGVIRRVRHPRSGAIR
jgi:hypothetical protein